MNTTRQLFGASLVLALVGCGGGSADETTTGAGGNASSGGTTASGAGGSVSNGGATASGGTSAGGASMGSGGTSAMTDLPLSPAADLGNVEVTPNRSSVVLHLPEVAGAKDYRVFAVEDGVTVSVTSDNREHIDGGTLHCSGLRQRNQCNEDEKLPIVYNNPDFDITDCDLGGLDRRPNVPTELMHTVEVDGVGPNTTLVVEAIDRQCPFPGLFGVEHEDPEINGSDVGPKLVDVVVDDQPYTLTRWPDTFPVRTEAEIRADYGSMILNGQGPNLPTLDPNSPNYPESPYIRLAQPAPADDPIVLARSVIQVSPLGNASLPDGFTEDDYFDDFDDDTDQPVLLRETDYTGTLVGLPVKVYENKKWVFYNMANGFGQFFVNRGQLNMVFGDFAQGSMTTQAMYPKRPAKLPEEDDKYLHVTYDVQRNETPRRYENFSLCGAEEVGQTYDGETPKAGPLPRPNFMNDADTTRTNALGWNCLLIVPRGNGYGVLPGGDIDSHPDSSARIIVVGAHPAPTGPDYDGQRIGEFAKNFGPTQEQAHPVQWMRQIDSSGNPVGMWLDDVLNVWQKAKFDVYVRRNRVVVYVEGQQRLCQDLTARPLTMAEGAIGFWHIIYHSSAEFIEIRDGSAGNDPNTGQSHILRNVPFGDQRGYDNVGFREDVDLPADFDASVCDPGTE